MPKPFRNHPQPAPGPQKATAPRPALLPVPPANYRPATLASLLALSLALLPGPAPAADTPRASVGEAYIYNDLAAGANQTALLQPDTAPLALLRRAAAHENPRPVDLLHTDSAAWAGAPGLLLTRGRPEVLLAENVLATTGDGQAAAAAFTDGTLRLFGLREACPLTMPGGHPAFALGLSRAGGVLAAWAPGRGELLFFDLNAQDCQPTALRAPLTGGATLTLSPSGAVVAAHDSTGMLWAGPRQLLPAPGKPGAPAAGKSTATAKLSPSGTSAGAAVRVQPDVAPSGDALPASAGLRPLAQLSGSPAALGFTQGEGVLIVVDGAGRGSAWNPRSGKALRSFEVPGGPFVRGEIQHDDVLLWTRQGELVRWDVLRNERVEVAEPQAAETLRTPKVQSQSASAGWLELRGTALFFVAERRGWQAAPVYELPNNAGLPFNAGLALSHSARAGCLRLRDVDGQVRYYSAATGAPAAQCFADDWSSVPVRVDGTASIPGLALRLFTPLPAPGAAQKNSQVNARAISEQSILLWTPTPRTDGSPALPGANTQTGALLGSVAVGAAPPQYSPQGSPLPSPVPAVSIPLRRGLSAQEPPRLLPLE